MHTTFYAYYNLYLIQYPLCTPPWNIFAPPCRARGACAIKYFGVPLKMTPPAPAPPAILAYLTLANKLSVSWDTIHYMKPPTATPPSLAPGASSAEWHAEWTRGLHLADTTKPLGAAFSGAFVSGSLEGTWEGLFTVRSVHYRTFILQLIRRNLVHGIYGVRSATVWGTTNRPTTKPSRTPSSFMETQGTPFVRG